MTSVPGSDTAMDIPLLDDEFAYLADLAKREFGLSLADAKKPLIHSRLSRRLKAREVRNFANYFTLLSHADEVAERSEFVSALTTNVTSFFREEHHFSTLKDHIPALREKSEAGEKIRIWSAGCSTGQEPYSIALTLLNHWPRCMDADLKILATDLDSKVVARAMQGQYPKTEESCVPAALKSSALSKPPSKDMFEFSSSLKSMIRFAELNLMDQWPFEGKFDVIFCRNVAIYFDQVTQQNLWQRMRKHLHPGGLMFIGHSERISGPALQHLQLAGITSYIHKPSHNRDYTT